ncbi:MAG: glycosyltransferase [Acidobacteriota bacterium]
MADYAAEIIPDLASSAELRLVEPPDWAPQEEAGFLAGLERVPASRRPARGWVNLLHLGNNPYHLWVARRLRQQGGIVVLHDTVLHHLAVEEAAAGEWERFGEELATAHGAAGRALAQARQWGFPGRLDPFLFPSRQVYLRHAQAVIVHSAAAAREVARSCPDLAIRQVPLAVAELPAGDRVGWRTRLGVAPGELALVHLGFLTPVKGLDVVLRALAALAELEVPFRLVVVGEGAEGSAFAALAAAAGLRDRVVFWGYASREELGGILAAADVGLVPRYPTAGETSAAALRFLATGVPVVVSGYGQFLELPQDAALRIPPGREGVADLVRWVASLAGDPEDLQKRRHAARKAWLEGGHEPARAAASLAAALKELAGKIPT